MLFQAQLQQGEAPAKGSESEWWKPFGLFRIIYVFSGYT